MSTITSYTLKTRLLPPEKLVFADLQWFNLSPCSGDVEVYLKILWHHCMWLQVQQDIKTVLFGLLLSPSTLFC